MKKTLKTVIALSLVCIFAIFAIASGSSDSSDSADQGEGAAGTTSADNTSLGQYSVEIASSRLAEDYEGKDVIIVKYNYTNVASDTATSFMTAFDDHAYQDGVGLNEAYFLADSANYSADNQTKEIKKGSSIEVEVAYELNDTETDVLIEIGELFSFNDKTISKTFTIK